MKKTLLALILVVFALNASAQFEKGTKYANLSLTGFDMSYQKNAKFHFGIEAHGGYFLQDVTRTFWLQPPRWCRCQHV